jgi:hypothetical protein
MAKKTPLFIATTSMIVMTFIYLAIKFLFDSGFNWIDIPMFAILSWITIFISWKYF